MRRSIGVRADDGASAVEYGLIVVALAAIIVSVLFLLGGRTQTMFSESCDTIASGQGDASC